MSEATQLHQRGEFLHRLESLRGIAALMVAGGHAFIVLQATGWHKTVQSSALYLLNGHAAVTIFFVLSGFVLGQSLRRAKRSFPVTYFTFGLRRILRIWPAHVCACVFILVCILVLRAYWPVTYGPEVSGWFAKHWVEQITPSYFFRNAVLLDTHLNLPTWTLRAEAVCSLSLPLLYAIHKIAGPKGRAVLLACLITCSFLLGGNLAAWSFMFYLGLLLPSAGPWLMQRISRERNAALALILLSALFICASVHVFQNHLHIGNVIEAAGAALLIASVLYGAELRCFRILDWKATRFYGRISFSFYLYNMVILFVVTRAAVSLIGGAHLQPHFLLTSLCLFSISGAITTAIAHFSYKFVEAPGVAFSKRLCGIIERRDAGDPQTAHATPASQDQGTRPVAPSLVRVDR